MVTMEQFWVFGYGSLMWKPGFAFEEREPGVVHGFRRALCVFSHVHRGTPERPGLVLGLDAGGSCHGVGYRVAAANWPAALSYLREREQVTMVYREITTPVRLLTSGRLVRAVAYAVDRRHPQYAGRLEKVRLIELVRRGEGKSGRCVDYVANTVAHLRELGIHDASLEHVVAALGPQAKASGS